MRQALQGMDDIADAILLWNGTKRDANQQLSKALELYENCSKANAKRVELDKDTLEMERAKRDEISENISRIDEYLELWSRWMLDPLNTALDDEDIAKDERIVESFEEYMETDGALATLRELRDQQGLLRNLLGERRKKFLALDGQTLASELSKREVQSAQEELCFDDEDLPRATPELLELLKSGVGSELKALESKLHEAKEAIRPVLARVGGLDGQPEDVAVLKKVFQSPCKGKNLHIDKEIREGLRELHTVLLFLRSMPEVKLKDLEQVWKYDAAKLVENCDTILSLRVQQRVSGSASALPPITDEVMAQLRESVDSHSSFSDSLRQVIYDLKVPDGDGEGCVPQTAGHWQSIKQSVAQQTELKSKISSSEVLRGHLEHSSNLAQSVSVTTELTLLAEELLEKFEPSQLSQEKLEAVAKIPNSKFDVVWNIQENVMEAISDLDAIDAIMQCDEQQLKQAVEQMRQGDAIVSEGCQFEVEWCGKASDLEDVKQGLFQAALLRFATAEMNKKAQQRQNKGWRGFIESGISSFQGLVSGSNPRMTAFFDSVRINQQPISTAEDWKCAIAWLKSIDVLIKVAAILRRKAEVLTRPAALLRPHQILSEVLQPLISQLSTVPELLASFSACVLPDTRNRILSAGGSQELEVIRALAQRALDSLPKEKSLLSKLLHLPTGDRTQMSTAVSDLKALCCQTSSVSELIAGLDNAELQALAQWAAS
eukprot:3822584-Rhodomonas_salina.4